MSWGGGLAARVVACVVAMMVMLTGTFAAYSYADDTIPDFFSNPLGAIQTAFARATGRAVANATWEVDPSTADDWYNDLTTASEADGEDVLSSKNVGRVWTDKTVFGSEAVLTNHENDRTITITNDDPNSALVALSALSSTMTIEGETEIEPLDIVLVLDTSNGMNDTMNSFAYSAAYSPQTGETYYVETDNGVYEAVTHNGMAWVNDEGDVFVPKNSEGDTTEGSVAFLERTPTSQQKMDALKDAATNFINQTASANAGITDPANRHRVSIVKYGGATSDNIGNDMNNTTMGEENATQIVKEFTECTGQGTTDLIEAVGGLRQQGSTSALDLGLEKADEVLDGGRASAKKVVIVFTGSYPTHTSINPADSPMVVYGNAVEAASQIKADDNTVIYNIGVFAGANPSDTTAYGVNQALNGVSSKYPDASVDKTNPYAPTINLGEPSDEGEFYFAANNTDELNNIFNLIRQSIESQAESPLAAGQGGSGSITFTDTTGAYTEVKDFKSIVFAGVQYDQKTSSTSEDGKVTTYTFTQSVTNPNPVYPNAGALNSIQIKVTHSDDLATGDTVEVVIPDTLLPMRHYQASVEEGVVTTDSDPAYPIRVFYTVGVKDEALNTLADPDEALGAYMEENKGQTNCQVQFYSNDYADQANGKTTAVFEPSTENSFYYFAEDTPVLTNNNLQDYESGASHLVGEIDPNATYYWVNRYIVEGKNDWQYEFVAFQGSELTAENKTTDPDTGRVLIKAGTPHADRPSTFTTQKDENKTNTADNAISPSWSGTGAVTVSLGNNGRVTHAVPGIIEVYKDVNWGDGTKDANKEFTFTLLLGDEANTEDVAGTFSYEVYTDGADEPVRVGTIVDGGTFTLKDGEHVVINGVPAGTSYKVVETATPGFTSNQPNDTVSGTTVCKQKDTYTFTNTYTVEPVTLPGEENLPVSKTLTGLSWDNAPEFDFTLTAGNEATAQAVNDGVVTITSGSTTVSKNDVTQGTTGTAYFGNDKTGITFTKPGDYVFTVSEIIPDTATNPGVDDGATQYKDATAEQKAMAGWQLDGITYTNTTHTLTFHVTDYGDGTMTVTPDAGNPDVVFTNEYRATGSATLSAVKAITGRDFQAGDAFTFTVEGTYKGDATVDPVPLPDGAANGSITIQPTAGETSFAFDLGTIAFTAPGTYIYTLTESDQGLPAGVGHDKSVYTVTYVVEDNHKGELTVQGGKPTIQVGDETKDAISWTNAYDPADATETVTASKTLTGRDSLPDEEFTFTLMPTGDTVQAVKDGKITGIDAEKGATVSIGELKNGVAKDGSFGELTFTEAGEYTFEITENRPADATEASNYTHNGVTYDATTGTVTITVTDLDDEGNNTGQLVANVEYGTTTETDNVFINTYKPTPTTGKVAVSGTKTVDDQIGTFTMEDDQFAFSFAPAGNAPMPDPEKTQIDGVTFVTQNYGGADHTVAKVTNTGTKGLTSTFDFSKLEIPFTQAGTYQYYVVEDDTLTWDGAPEVVPGISYDGTQYRVTFTVTEEQATGALSASISKVEVRGADAQWTEVRTDELDFENVYSAEVKQNRQINKTLNGRDFIDSDTLQFDVEVTAVDHTNGNAPIAGADIPTPAGTSGATMSTPQIDGDKVTYSFTVDPTVGTNTATFNTGDVTYTHVGTYTYKISEHGTDAASVAYDTSEYVIKVKVDQVNENGQVVLKPETTITKDGETYSLIQLNFVNTYTTNGELDGDTYLKVSKTVANRPWNDGESFDFTITAKTGPNNMAVKDIPMPTSSELTLSKDGDNATVSGAFGNIKYTVPGTYTYEIAEITGSNSSLAYSGAKYTVTVTATDLHDGTMNVTATMTRTVNDQGVAVSGDDATVADNTAAFTNTYTPGVATLAGTELMVSKNIDGRDWQNGDTFGFTLAADMNHAETKAAVDAKQITMSATTATITNTSPTGAPDTTRTAGFGNIQFTKAGTYQFIVTENESTVNGVDRPTDYDRTVVVQVTENTLDGTMTAELADSSEELTFTNIYDPDPLTLSGATALKVQKTLPGAVWADGSFSGRDWADGETFGFTITRTDNGDADAVTMPSDLTATVNKPANGSVNTANFGDITFNEPGTYTFEITETAHNGEAISADPQNGMTYDRHTATVTVVVDDNKTEGKLVATSVTYNNDDAPSQTDANNDDIAAFTNTYTAASGAYDRVSVAKVLTGRDWLATDAFTFDLAFKEATDLPAGAPSNAADLYELPDNATDLSVTNQSNPVQTGGDGTGYSAQYGAITFHAPGLYTFTVREDVPEKTNGITYDRANPKEFTVQVTDNGQGQLEASLADDSSSNLQFTNSYAATGTLTGSTYLKVAKNLPTTRPWGDGDTFTMQIEAISNTAGIDDADMPKPADATVELTKDAQSGSFDSITFTKAGTYVYRITEQRPTGVDAGEKVNGLIYSQAVYEVTVTVEDNNFNGTFDVSSTMTRVMNSDGSTPETPSVSADNTARFYNNYQPTGTLVGANDLKVSKTLDGRDWADGETYTFQLDGDATAPMPGNAQGNVEITLGKPASGDTATGSFGDITYTSVTTSPYIYTITELGHDANGVTISKAKYQVSVTVTDPNHDGQLVVKSTMTRLTDDKGGEVSGDAATVADNTAAFTNTYKAAETTATLNVEKVVTGADAPEDFEFALAFAESNKGPEDGVSGLTGNIATVAGADLTLAGGAEQDAETTSFGELTFSKAGVYTFAITETTDDYGNGWSYDNDDPNTVTVTVEDNDNGALVVTSVEYTDEDTIAVDTDTAATFTNRYTAGAAMVDDLSVTKQVEGNATDEDFTFELTLISDNAANIEGLGEGNKVTATATDPFSATANKEATQKVMFSPLTFTEPGDYTFTVAETNTAPENTSWIYGADDSNGQQITVKVRDNGKGALVADGTDPAQESGIEGNNPTIVNRYKATGTATITVEKVIRNRDWLADDRGTEEYEGDSFDFALTVAGEETKKAVENGNVVMPTGDDATTTVTSDTVDHKAAFGEITFNVPGTYTFDVTEQGQSHDGLTYDTDPKQVTVEVADNGDGTLTATIRDDAANNVADGVVTITNIYTAGGTVDLPEGGIDLTKVLKGRAWNESDAFTFTIAGKSATATDGKTAIDSIPMPEETQVTLGYADIAKNDDGTPATTEDGWNYADLAFGAIRFSQPGTYVYTVTEADTGNAGMTEPAPAEVTITVTDNLHGGYAATVTSVTGSPLVNVYGTQLDYSDAGGLTIVKTMSNQDIAEGEFGFTVTPDDAESAALLGLDIDTWTEGQGKEFSTHAADLEIDANGNGVATAPITVLDNAAFTHEHDGSTYGFTIAETKAAEGNGYAKDTTVYHVAIAVADDAQGTITATTTVTVTTADPAHPHDGATYTYTNTGEGATGPAQVTFTNDYDAQGALGEGAIKATKTLTNGQLMGSDFGFSVYDATGAKVASGTNAADGTITLGAIGYSTDQLMRDVLSNAADYVGKVDGKDTYTYAYTVREDTDAATGAPLDAYGNAVPGVMVNAGSFQITVTVTDNGNGELSAQVAYPQGTDHLAFRNTYGTVPGGAETLLVGGRKALDTGTTSGENVPTLADIAGKYTFTIQGSVVVGEDGPVPMPERTTATNDAAGNVTFGDIEFSIENVWGEQTDAVDGGSADAGVATRSAQRTKRFQYLVSEEGDVPGITNGVAQVFFVTVTDNGDGTVDVKCTSGNTGSTIELTPGEQFTITNEYRVAPVESSVTDAVSITKTLDGRALNEGEFTFDMALVSAPGETDPGFSVLTATNDADGAVSFPKLTFSQVGTYVYRISEEHGDLGGIAYDDSTYTATATVTDNGDGTLSVEWAVTDADGQTVGKKGVIFANTYTADPATVGLAATKVLGGRELKDGEFTFELARTGEDAPMPGDAQEDTIRLTNAADGTIAIDPIIFTQPGEYRYTLREVNGDAEGVTYDDAEHVITVTVTDNLLGALEADVSIDDGAATGIVFTNTYTAPAESDMPASGSAVAGTAVIAAMLLIAAAGIGVASKRTASRRGSNR